MADFDISRVFKISHAQDTDIYMYFTTGNRLPFFRPPPSVDLRLIILDDCMF